MDGRTECIKLGEKILKGKISGQKVRIELDRIVTEYGEDIFNKYCKVKKQSKPWTEETLKELEIFSMAGVASRDFYLYMAEVADEVYSRKKKKKALKVGAGITALLVVIAIIIFVVNHQS